MMTYFRLTRNISYNCALYKYNWMNRWWSYSQLNEVNSWSKQKKSSEGGIKRTFKERIYERLHSPPKSNLLTAMFSRHYLL